MRTFNRFVVIVGLAVGAASCGEVNGDSRSPVLLRVTGLTANGGAILLSDVRGDDSISNDTATATLASTMKNTTLSPTPNNEITLNRYRVEFRRADGRNTPGVDVPYPFDGAVTTRIAAGGTGSVVFEIVRHVAKEESPLVQLATNRNEITTIATITFYGTDTVGNVVSASGEMTVNFGNFAG